MGSNIKISLKELLTRYKIQIPILQRDYAQGRNKQSAVRANFLNSLFDFLNSTGKEKSLDFIYGYEDKGKFLPIDGQQRITTLWLLYIYLSSNLSDKSKYDFLLNFTYATRDEAKKFCKELVNFSFSNAPSTSLKQNQLMNSITSDNDPTIISMVTMLDDIYYKFKDIDNDVFLDRLNQIKFNVINMGEYNLGEELYIKMNSRGKLLSSFENFKSWLEQDKEVEKDYELLASIDNNWINFFWKRNKSGWEDDIIRMMSYFAMFFIQYDKYDNILVNELIKQHLAEPFTVFNDKLFVIENRRIFSYANLRLMDRIIMFMSGSDCMPKDNANQFHIPKLFAIFFYVINNNHDIDGFTDWINVTNHIINNSRSSVDIDRVVDTFKLLEEYAPQSRDIIYYLSKQYDRASGYAHRRIQEEIDKSRLICSDGRGGMWEQNIDKIQNHSYFNGWIDFLLEYCYKESVNEYSMDKFIEYSKIISLIFEKEFLNQYLFLLQRALLTLGDYPVYLSNYFLGNSDNALATGKEPWHRIFEAKIGDSDQPIMKALLEELSNKASTINEVSRMLELFIDSNKTNVIRQSWWRYIIISHEECLAYCKDNRFYYENGVIYLIVGKKFAKKGLNLLGYGLYLYFKASMRNISEYSDLAEDDYHFDVQGIKVQSVYMQNKICVEGDKFFIWTNDYNTIEDFYAEIYNYIQTLP